jgi:hypothetical protein
MQRMLRSAMKRIKTSRVYVASARPYPDYTSAMRRIKRRSVDPLLQLFGIEVREISSELDNFMISERLKSRSIDMVTAEVGAFLRSGGHVVDAEKLRQDVASFYSLASHCPVRQSTGGCGFNAGLELFVTARQLNPALLIESGVYRGFTTWVLRQAVPRAKIVSFDIDLSRLRRREAGVEYVEADISTYDFRALPTVNALCFFDDHVSQALRIDQARLWGFRNLIFDDNLPAHALHGDGFPPFPTVDMVFSDDEFADGELIEWKASANLQYKVDKAALVALRRSIAFVGRFPNLWWQTGYHGSNLTYVRLSSSET